MLRASPFVVLAVLFVAGSAGCNPPPAKGSSQPPAAEAAEASSVGGPAEADAAKGEEAPESPEAADPTQEVIGLGFKPGEVAVLDWTVTGDKRSGKAILKLPSGEVLSGEWKQLDNRTADADAGRRVDSPNPIGDPGDKTTLPSGRTSAHELVVDLLGDRGTKVHCAVPLKPGVALRSQTGQGTCHGPNDARFRVRLR